MAAPIIQVERLAKKYELRHKETRSTRRTFAEELADALKRPFRRSSRSVQTREEFWALRDVSFEVPQGEVLGVIGRNGAGKSTLLKILGRITEPTQGRVHLRGRVASLLEVGTGFHPELTGRENIFLNGAILGMSRAEIRKNFDAIVAFSEVEKFLDTPVKRYSSGMYVRLAFSVAAHLEPEILIVDEVLAVGDQAFQQKCLGKMRGIAQTEGRTVLFVSHNMPSIRQLCQRVCLLHRGQIETIADADSAIGKYLSHAVVARKVSLADWNEDRINSGEARILELEIQPGTTGAEPIVRMGESFRVRIHADIREPLVDPQFGIGIQDAMGTPLLDLRTVHHPLRLGRIQGPVTLELEVEKLGLYPGHYYLSPWISDATCKHDVDFLRMSCAFDVVPGADDAELFLNKDWGTYFVPSRWTVL